jgi:hypothetical protein
MGTDKPKSRYLKDFFTQHPGEYTLISQLKKSGWLARMGWLAERPLRRRDSAATDKSTLGYAFVF